MADKEAPAKPTPQPQNSGAPEKPRMPESRVVQGNDPRDDAMQMINRVPHKP